MQSVTIVVRLKSVSMQSVVLEKLINAIQIIIDQTLTCVARSRFDLTQLGEARAQLAWRRQIYTRYRTFFQLSERVLDRPTDRVLRAFQQRAFRRAACACAASYSEVGVHVARNACVEHLGLYNARAYGLCISRGLLHKDVM